MRSRRSETRLVLAVAALLVGCSKHQDEESPKEEPRVRRASTATFAADVPDAPLSATTDAAAPRDAAPEPFDAALPPVRGTIRCGNKVCKAGPEICCTLVDEAEKLQQAACVPNRPLYEHERGRPGLICHRAFPPRAYDDKSVAIPCDDSADCADGEVCCEQSGGSGQPSQYECVPLTAGERFTCYRDEQCAGGAKCRTPHTTCSRGSCVDDGTYHPAPVDCGGRVCPAAMPICCATDAMPRCTTAKGCKSDDWIGCTAGSQCGRGEFCAVVAAIRGTFCTHTNDGMTAAACTTSADCRAFCSQQAAPRCEPAAAGEWHGGCRCDY